MPLQWYIGFVDNVLIRMQYILKSHFIFHGQYDLAAADMDELDLCSLITSQLPRSLFSICKKLVVLELSKSIVLDVLGLFGLNVPRVNSKYQFKWPFPKRNKKH
jgi:hypothetical protein